MGFKLLPCLLVLSVVLAVALAMPKKKASDDYDIPTLKEKAPMLKEKLPRVQEKAEKLELKKSRKLVEPESDESDEEYNVGELTPQAYIPDPLRELEVAPEDIPEPLKELTLIPELETFEIPRLIMPVTVKPRKGSKGRKSSDDDDDE